MTLTIASDLDIARAAALAPLTDIARDAGIPADCLEPYGRHVAKITDDAAHIMADRAQAKYVVVTAITPTPLGEGKTTTAVGLAQGFKHLGKHATLALRQPSMGPTFGIKGGAAGAGYSQVVPMETLNLHLTGDFHAITAAHNMLSAMLDNHLHHGNALGIDPRRISWRRVVDINDRSLRNVVLGLGARIDGVPRQSGFDITAASEVGVALALATSLQDLRRRLGRIVVGYSYDGEAVTAEDLKAAGAMTVIMRDAIKPNLMQTIEHTPALIHAGPFGNIATGNSSIIADLVGIRMGDYLITEAGFGADMGAERFVNVKCRESGLRPDAAVLVVTVRALKAHSGRYKITAGKPLPEQMLQENPDDVRAGADNLRAHLRILSGFGITPVVAINAFPDDHDSEHDVIREIATEVGAHVAVSTHVVDGGAGAVELAKAVAAACDEEHEFRFTYDLEAPLKEKITAVATKVYGAHHVAYAPEAEKNLAEFERLGYGNMPVVMAKTHLSISHDPTLRGAPTGWTLPVREVRLAAGAGYVYAICGEMRTMPGLSKSPAAERIDIDDDGNIVGLF
ncbi:Formate--tetrahydrofolate ligase [Austwickia sp. TVS 96-490-7B]|uniref:formate--tetrahydrofolate ligase n=1 Tax=Austwickia sp. TVS 96-490-7B TaxID=2830843 RepID=UPI001C59A8C6|nr:formate--tetrahydrofolate ligase [Austwickia sp. TVS 96-490-7B]MBW3086218.1 Formate--tetrahydrofolate ligase [Austwickia sp. TVS 96-490-7B]